eukprot:gene41806-11643_t
MAEIMPILVVHRRKLLRQIAQLQASGKSGTGTGLEQEALVLEMNVTRASADTRLGLALTEREGKVIIREAGMTVMKINATTITTQESFMMAIKGRAQFTCHVTTKDGRLPRGAFESLFPTAREGQQRKDDYEKLRLIGCGARDDGQLYALKVMEKRRVLECGQGQGDGGKPTWRRDQLLRERDMMKHTQWTQCHLLVRLHYTFQSRTQLFFVLDYCAGGDLYEYLGTKDGSCLPEPTARYYAAQVFLALRALHALG